MNDGGAERYFDLRVDRETARAVAGARQSVEASRRTLAQARAATADDAAALVASARNLLQTAEHAIDGFADRMLRIAARGSSPAHLAAVRRFLDELRCAIAAARAEALELEHQGARNVERSSVA